MPGSECKEGSVVRSSSDSSIALHTYGHLVKLFQNGNSVVLFCFKSLQH